MQRIPNVEVWQWMVAWSSPTFAVSRMLPNLTRRRFKGFVTRLAKRESAWNASSLLIKGKRYTSPTSEKNVHKGNLKCY